MLALVNKLFVIWGLLTVPNPTLYSFVKFGGWPCDIRVLIRSEGISSSLYSERFLSELAILLDFVVPNVQKKAALIISAAF